MNRIASLMLPLAAILGIAGCAAGPDYRRPEVAQPARFRNALEAPGDAGAAPPDAWWRAFGDPQLARVVELAGARNLDLAQAAARIAQARADAGAAGAALLPSGALQASGTRVSQSLLDPTAVVAQGSPAFERGFSLAQVDVASSWELDLFGGLRRGREAARADLEAAVASGDALRVAVTAEAADAYLQLRAEQARLDVARRQEEVDGRLADLVSQREREGLASEREVHEARAALEGVRAAIPPLRSGIEVQLERLRVLTGDEAGGLGDELRAAAAQPAAPRVAMAEGPAALLRRRPDVVAAERRVAAANARIGAALAQYYPQVSVSALFGVTSIVGGRLFTGDALDHQFGAGLRWRLFDFGRIDAEVAGARGRDAEALAAYRAAVLRACSEVEVALSELVEQRRRAEALEREAAELQQASDQSRQAYDAGAASLIEVLDADREWLQASDRLALARAGAAQAAVASYRALGGGWHEGGMETVMK